MTGSNNTLAPLDAPNSMEAFVQLRTMIAHSLDA